MKVAQLLNRKGHDVVTVKTGASLQDISNVLTLHDIGAAVVVTESGGICGIISERDTVRKIAEGGADVLSLPVSCSMTPDVMCASGQEDMDEVLALMSERRFRHLPVMEQGALSGLISIGDAVKHKIETAERNAEDLMRYIVAG